MNISICNWTQVERMKFNRREQASKRIGRQRDRHWQHSPIWQDNYVKMVLLCICKENLSNKSEKKTNKYTHTEVHTEMQKVEMKRQSNFTRLNCTKFIFFPFVQPGCVNLSNFSSRLFHKREFLFISKFLCKYPDSNVSKSHCAHLKRAQVQHKVNNILCLLMLE